MLCALAGWHQLCSFFFSFPDFSHQFIVACKGVTHWQSTSFRLKDFVLFYPTSVSSSLLHALALCWKSILFRLKSFFFIPDFSLQFIVACIGIIQPRLQHLRLLALRPWRPHLQHPVLVLQPQQLFPAATTSPVTYLLPIVLPGMYMSPSCYQPVMYCIA